MIKKLHLSSLRVFFTKQPIDLLELMDCRGAKSAPRNDGNFSKNICHKVARLFTATILCFGLTSCVSSKYIEQKQYLLTTKMPVNKHATRRNKISLYIDPIIAEAPFDQFNFLYRINKYQYLTDYYNGFLMPPAQQLEAILINYIKNSNNFTLQNIALTASNTLKVSLNEFYADYCDNKKPEAIISIRFELIRSSDNMVILDKNFTRKIALTTKNTEGLLLAWSIGLQNILISATRALDQCTK